jgi:hypothetical protein
MGFRKTEETPSRTRRPFYVEGTNQRTRILSDEGVSSVAQDLLSGCETANPRHSHRGLAQMIGNTVKILVCDLNRRF